MIIIRDSRLPRFDISKKKDASMLDYVNLHPSICSRMICNGKYCEITFENQSLTTAGEWKHSSYTIVKSFDDGSHIISNTLSDGCVYLNKHESEWYYHTAHRGLPQDFAKIMCLGGFYIEKSKDEYQLSKLLQHRHTYCDYDYFSVTILPTQDCNARCFYCFEQEKKPISMSEDVVYATIQYLCDRLSPGCTLAYTWFGGEPLLSHNTVDRIISGVNAQMDNAINYSSSLITNGSLLTPSLIDKLKSLWRTTTVVLTLDGYDIEHDKRKSYKCTSKPDGSAYRHALTNISDLLAAGIRVTCRLNLDKKNIGQLPSMLADLKLYSDNPAFSVQATTLHCPDPKQSDNNRYYRTEELPTFYDEVLHLLKNYNLLSDPLKMLPTGQEEIALRAHLIR